MNLKRVKKSIIYFFPPEKRSWFQSRGEVPMGECHGEQWTGFGWFWFVCCGLQMCWRRIETGPLWSSNDLSRFLDFLCFVWCIDVVLIFVFGLSSSSKKLSTTWISHHFQAHSKTQVLFVLTRPWSKLIHGLHTSRRLAIKSANGTYYAQFGVKILVRPWKIGNCRISDLVICRWKRRLDLFQLHS